MPVKLSENGDPLDAKMAKPAAKTATAPVQAPTNAVDALLEQAATIPEAKQQPALATAEVGIIQKDGAITVETTEYIRVWLKPPTQEYYAGPYGKVTYGMAATVNTGNYENFRPFVQIEVPFIPGQQDEAYAYAESWADARISNIVAAAKAAISGA